MEDIYQRIWNVDMQGNGVPALRPNETQDPTEGFAVVDERSTQVGTDHRVLSAVDIPESKMATYRLCEAIFDNYALERAATELIRPDERQEELDFIDAILPTPPIQLARQHMEQVLGLMISDQTLAGMIRETWFTFGRAGSQRDATGFEHVFVGEQSSKRSKVGGYHFWYKYYLDDGGRTISIDGDIGDGVDRMEYRGTRYSGADDPDKGILVPEVITLSLQWNAPSGDGGNARVLEKSIGGFFVGLSPEGLIAMGLVRTRTLSGKTAKINGAQYQLDLHRLDGSPNAIRTFFPRFQSADVVAIDDGGNPDPDEEPRPEPDTPDVDVVAAASFRIVAAMINPVNPEGGREFLQIINTGNSTASLENWRALAPNGMSFTFARIMVTPGDIFKFVFPVANGVVRNRGGDIRLVMPDGTVAQTCRYTREDTSDEGAPVLFV
ncbi:MAG: hypothetical protein GY703_22675 [Gammaproteobacteria bacterium]|nr:hypothetical protein [Gammaproteobacteria bacterium]